MSLGENYPRHLETLDDHLTEALAVADRLGLAIEGVLFHAGRVAYQHRDDRPFNFAATPHFRRWLPLEGPEHVVLARPGQKPHVVRVQPQDYWHDTSPAPVSYWEEHVELSEVAHFDDIPHVLGDLPRIAYVGNSEDAAKTLGIDRSLVEPDALIAPLDWYRAYKTEHEIDLSRRAALTTAAGHAKARELFLQGASERQIHWAYLEASDQLEFEVPYDTIVAFDEKSAILHYQNKRGAEAAPGQVFLLDAGSAFQGYAIDVTRTWAQESVDSTFQAILKGVDALEQELVAMITVGRPYVEIHQQAHRGTARLLAETGVYRCSADEAFDRGLTHPFLPHGVGHQLGIQVHDVGGHQAGPEGGKMPPPSEYPFLRNTRVIEEGHLLTIEPGIYFIPMLLDPLREGADCGAIDWDLVDRLLPLGGVRIEDDVLCTADGPDDLTRHLIPGP